VKLLIADQCIRVIDLDGQLIREPYARPEPQLPADHARLSVSTMSRDISLRCRETSQNGARGTRTPDLLGAIQALSQLSYSPVYASGVTVREASKCSHRRERASAVWFVRAMGLLDDAIREHLELKRRRGADPGEVAREQREALEPVPRDQRSEGGGGVAIAEDLNADAVVAGDADAASTGADSAAPVGGDPRGDDSAVAPTGATGSGDPSAVVQETAELDMQTVLDGREDEPVTEAGAGPDVESLEWEVPGEVAVEPSADVASHAPTPGGDVDESARSEDVLEETPDFLRETPEEDRLWFEQRPPRDFDFDK
jgi:hypothetical protein